MEQPFRLFYETDERKNMNIVFVSGFLNNHLLPICEELNRAAEFTFIATQSQSFDNLCNRATIEKSYVCKYFDPKGKEEAIEKISRCDFAIFGGSSDELLRLAKNQDKLCFIYSERLFKLGAWRRFVPSVKRVYGERFLSGNKNVYVLAAGSYVSGDLGKLGFPIEKCFKFGYFPMVSDTHSYERDQINSVKTLQLLYAGRLIKLKRVKDVIRCSKVLCKEKIDHTLTIVGEGSERNKLEKLAMGIPNITFVGGKEPSDVFEYMKNSDAMIMSSNRMEGWGAVVNEAMSLGCPVICSDACGSARFLIKNGENGFVYRSGNASQMVNAVKKLQDKELLNQMKTAARETIYNEWNACVAVERLLTVAEEILKGNPSPNLYGDGPLSMC